LIICVTFWSHGLKSVLTRVNFWLESQLWKIFDSSQTLLGFKSGWRKRAGVRGVMFQWRWWSHL